MYLLIVSLSRLMEDITGWIKVFVSPRHHSVGAPANVIISFVVVIYPLVLLK